jgi:hypothetical protein
MEQEGNTFADYIAIVKRRFTIVMASFVAVLIVGVYVGYSLPATYRSTGTIAIQPQNISADFVQTTVTTLVRTELAQDVGFLWPADSEIDGQRAGEDWEFTRGCMAYGAKISHLVEHTWLWHHDSGNTSGLPDRW